MDASTASNEPSGAGVDGGLRPLLVDAKQAARLLSIGRTMLYELIAAGAITPMHIGRCARFAVADLERFVAEGCVIAHEPRPTIQAIATTRPRSARTVQANRPALRLFD